MTSCQQRLTPRPLPAAGGLANRPRTAPDHAVLCEVSRPVSQWSESDCILKCGGGDWLWAANVDVRLGPRKGDVTGMLPAGAVTALASS